MRILVATDAWHPQVNGVVRTLTMMARAAQALGYDVRFLTPQSFATFAMPRPIFLSVGRVAVEKNLEAFLELDLPGTRVVVGDGPARAALQRKYPQAVFLGALHGEALAEAYAAADVFVFPSKTDTFGLVLLEALASGVPVAAFPVTGPRDVIGSAAVGVLSEDLRLACLAALKLSPQDCRQFAANLGWEASARTFVNNIRDVRAEIGSGLQIRQNARNLRPDPLRLAPLSRLAIKGVHVKFRRSYCRSHRWTSMPQHACSRRSRYGRRCCRHRRSTNASVQRFPSNPKCCSGPDRSSFASAFNKLSSIPQDARGGGVVAFSSGNHAQGVAAAAQILNMRATIVMPADAPRSKRERTKGYGAEVVLYDRDRERRP